MTDIISNKDTILWFGKHKGMSIKECISEYPFYIKWCLENDIIKLDKPATKHFKCMLTKRQNQYDEAKQKRYHNRYYSNWDIDEDMDWCLGLSGGAQGWD